MTSKILVVDDEREMCELVEEALEPLGHVVSWRTSGEAALELPQTEDFDVLLSDNQMGGMTGIELTQKALALRPELRVIIFTGFGNMDMAVEALRAGACDFVTKPVALEVLVLTVQRAVGRQELRHELRRLNGTDAPPTVGIIGSGPAMERVFEVVRRIATSNTTLLVLGETGTGKELVAQALHEQSGRTGPFIAINCSAMPEGLLESELFGHLPGAFTDARKPRSGLFVEASGGTLFLDEIGDMALGMQAKLLRALQSKAVRPLGGSQEVSFDTRIVAATNRDLEADVKSKRFREDLFYRINVVTAEVPPLRARKQDIVRLASHFLRLIAKRNGTTPLRLGARAAEILMAHDWPGNVRELENAVERAVAFARFDEITADDLPSSVRGVPCVDDLGIGDIEAELPEMQVLEERYIKRVLHAMHQNEAAAAKVLGMDLETLQRKLSAMGVPTGTGAAPQGSAPPA